MIGSGVYAIQNLVTGRTYIGSSRNLSRRWKVHLYDLKHGEHHARELQTDWQLYGESSFVFVVLERIQDAELLLISEQLHLDRIDNPYNTYKRADYREFCRELGYTNRGRVRSAATRAKIAAGHRGKKLSAAHRAKISAGLRGGKRSAETRRKMSESRRKVVVTWGPQISAGKKGKSIPAISVAKKGKPWSEKRRALFAAKVLQDKDK
jgi:group I intron endonuclease